MHAMWYNICGYIQTRCMRMCTVSFELEFTLVTVRY